MSSPWALGIDFGTTYTCAAVRQDGQTRVLHIDGEPRTPSAVFLDDDGRLLVGRIAESRGVLRPERFEPTPKRYLQVGQEDMLLGDRQVPLGEIVGAVLGLVWQEALRQHEGRRPEEVRLTHPASWQQDRKRLLLEAAAEAGIEQPTLITEPEAAAVRLSRGDAGTALGQGSLTLVFDLGGGTFDCAVLRRRGNRFQLVGMPCGDESIGGERFDDHLYDELGRTALPPDDWERLQGADDVAWSQANFAFRRGVREAKEAVSRSAAAPFLVPAPVGRELQVTRDGLERLIRTDIERTLEITERALATAGVKAGDLSAIYLVGGSTRIPLVLHMVQERFGPVTFKDDPKTVVALGAVAFDSALVEDRGTSDKEIKRARPPWAVPAAATAIALAVALFVILLHGGREHVGGKVLDSKGQPLANLPVTITMHGDGSAPNRAFHDVTNKKGEFTVVAKVDHKDSKSPVPTRYSASAEFPYRDGVWELELDDGPDNEGNQDDLVFTANVDGGSLELEDEIASLSLNWPPESVLGMYGDEAVATVHLKPLGPMVDGTAAEAFSEQTTANSFFSFNNEKFGLPLGPWEATAEIEGANGPERLFFDNGDGEPAATTVVILGPDAEHALRSVVIDPALTPPVNPPGELEW